MLVLLRCVRTACFTAWMLLYLAEHGNFGLSKILPAVGSLVLKVMY